MFRYQKVKRLDRIHKIYDSMRLKKQHFELHPTGYIYIKTIKKQDYGFKYSKRKS